MHRCPIGSQHIFSRFPKAVTLVENNPHLAVKEQTAVEEQSAAVLQNFKHNFIHAGRGLVPGLMSLLVSRPTNIKTKSLLS